MATVKCHSCGTDNYFEVTTELAKDQTLFMEIGYTGDLLKAATVWQTIQNFEKLLVAVGKDLNSKTSVSIKSINQSEGKLRVEFFVESVKV